MSDTFPCHPERARPAGLRGFARCPECGTLVRAPAAGPSAYGDDYPAARGHHDAETGACKVRTLERWLGALGVDPAGRVVCELGFGGGACLAALAARGARVFGLEPVAANRAHAARLGVAPERLFAAEPLPHLPERPDLWLFQDSFEHVPEPAALVRWLARESAARAAVLLVAPDAASPSHALLGPLWPHYGPDHDVHYTRAGVAALFARAGFRVARAFRPTKCVSARMLWDHLRTRAGAGAAARRAFRSGPRIWFNLGEMGLWLERDDDRRQAEA